MPGIAFMQLAAAVPLLFIMSQSQLANCLVSGTQTRLAPWSGARGPDSGPGRHS